MQKTQRQIIQIYILSLCKLSLFGFEKDLLKKGRESQTEREGEREIDFPNMSVKKTGRYNMLQTQRKIIYTYILSLCKLSQSDTERERDRERNRFPKFVG